MCGIMGYSSAPDISNTNKKYVQILAKNMLVGLSCRGRDATGYMACIDGNTVYYKKSIPSDRFVMNGYMDLKKFPHSLMAHTRAATSGSPAYNINNHPIIRDGFGIIHNGVIRSWELIHFELRKQMFSQTDSELLAVQIEKDGNMDNLVKVFDNSGSFALALMRKGNNKIQIMRDGTQPISIANLINPLQTVFFASTTYIIENAIKLTFSTFPKYKDFDVEDYCIYDLEDGKYSLIKNCTPDKKDEQKNYGTNYYTPIRNIQLLSRVETDVAKLFTIAFGEKECAEHLSAFVEVYYANGTKWYQRTEKESLDLATAWIEKQCDTFKDNNWLEDGYGCGSKYGRRGGWAY